MKNKIWYLVIVIILSVIAVSRWIVLLWKSNIKKTNTTNRDGFSPVIFPAQLREDFRGSGAYNAVRVGHRHEGIDLLCNEGQNVYAPFAGIITRVAYPYAGNTRWTALELVGDNGFTMKIFYVSPTKIGKAVQAGEAIAVCQAISKKYGVGMKDHIHVELLQGNTHLDPTPYCL